MNVSQTAVESLRPHDVSVRHGPMPRKALRSDRHGFTAPPWARPAAAHFVAGASARARRAGEDSGEGDAGGGAALAATREGFHAEAPPPTESPSPEPEEE